MVKRWKIKINCGKKSYGVLKPKKNKVLNFKRFGYSVISATSKENFMQNGDST